DQLGIFGFLLPWVFMFAITFGALMKSKVFGDDKRIMGVIALTVAFFVVGFGGPAFGGFFVGLFGVASMILAAILVIVLFITMSGGDVSKLMESKALVALIGGISLIIVFTIAGGTAVLSNDVVAMIFIVVIMGIAVYFIAGK
ncbi:MAG: hypothetical protein AABX69_00845, partial [Nanoarchaeota archaeon]